MSIILSFMFYSSQVILHLFVETVLIRKPCKKIVLYCCMKIKAKLSSANSLPSSNGHVYYGCYGDDAESSRSPGCSSFLEMCNAAVLFNRPHSSRVQEAVQVEDSV